MKETKLSYNPPKIEVNKESPDIEQIESFIQIVSSVPNWVPRTFYEQIAIYHTGGAATRLYVYDYVNKSWRYSSLT